MKFTDILSISATIVASLGGGTLVVFALSSWLGRVWATRIMERERAKLSVSIERVKAELTRSIEHEKAELAKFQEVHRTELQELSSQRQDALNRKRDVYSELAKKMRVLLRAKTDPSKQETDKQKFLAAYDKAYIWASEPVVVAIRDLLINRERLAVAAELSPASLSELQRIDAEAQVLYGRVMLEMRRDSGFDGTVSEYRLVSFG